MLKPSAYDPLEVEEEIPDNLRFEPVIGSCELSEHFEKVDCDRCGDFVALFKCKECGISAAKIKRKVRRKSGSDSEEAFEVKEVCEEALPLNLCEDCSEEIHKALKENEQHNIESTIKLTGENLRDEAAKYLYPAVDIHSKYLETILEFEPRWTKETMQVVYRNREEVMNAFDKSLDAWVKQSISDIERACDQKYEEFKTLNEHAASADIYLGKLRRFQSGYGDSSEDEDLKKDEKAYERYLEAKVLSHATEINHYTPTVGPLFRWEGFGERLKILARQSMNTEIVYDTIDIFQIINKGIKREDKNYADEIKMEQIEPGQTKVYDMEEVLGDHQHIKLFCFPMLLFPRPGYFDMGAKIKRQLEIVITTACKTGKLRKLYDPDSLVHQIGVHYKNGIGRRFIIRRVHDQIYPALNSEDWYRIDIRGWGLHTEEDFKERLERFKMQIECLKEEIFDNAREKKKLVDPFNQNILKEDPTRVKSEKELEKEKRKKRGFEIVENGTEMPNFIVRMRNRQCYALMLALLKKGQDRVEFEKDGETLVTEGPCAGWVWKTPTSMVMYYVDYFEMAPIEIQMDARDPFAAIGGRFFYFDGLLKEIKVCPLVLEGWIDLRQLRTTKERLSCRLLSERVRDSDIRLLMRNWMERIKNFDIQFVKQIYPRNENAWFVKLQGSEEDDYMKKLDYFMVGHEKN
ncbi:Oidioi.mRNA.OKI2018_I69.chr2.g8360.t2.cds [Oikopleura dioica]|uniref:Oidioi.mRNA.OKI2018_I69.chr2.g8360.t2.cds n=1 Tax=Oikopleura dioica TaxID=34765 RepID=A0ABN7T9I0_OIKDI|nr:Oidioi.mRNA.OKI2018_I69.chr2.g8360.t2.cds [Oikopleura dioica]